MPAGRPTKYTTKLADAICLRLRNGNTRTASVAAAGIDYSTFLRWLTEKADFAGAVEAAESSAEVAFVASIATAATAGDWRAALAWLERRRGPDWKRRTDIDVTSAGQPLKVTEVVVQLHPRGERSDPGDAAYDATDADDSTTEEE